MQSCDAGILKIMAYKNSVEAVVAAGRRLLKEGKKPTGSRLRAIIGFGTPARFGVIWDEHVASGGEGDLLVFQKTHHSLHSYEPPSHEEIIKAGENLTRKGVRVTGHTLRSYLNGRGTPSRMKSIWDSYIIILPKGVIMEHISKIEACFSKAREDGIEDCIDAFHKFKSMLYENALTVEQERQKSSSAGWAKRSNNSLT